MRPVTNKLLRRYCIVPTFRLEFVDEFELLLVGGHLAVRVQIVLKGNYALRPNHVYKQQPWSTPSASAAPSHNAGMAQFQQEDDRHRKAKTVQSFLQQTGHAYLKELPVLIGCSLGVGQEQQLHG